MIRMIMKIKGYQKPHMKNIKMPLFLHYSCREETININNMFKVNRTLLLPKREIYNTPVKIGKQSKIKNKNYLVYCNYVSRRGLNCDQLLYPKYSFFLSKFVNVHRAGACLLASWLISSLTLVLHLSP